MSENLRRPTEREASAAPLRVCLDFTAILDPKFRFMLDHPEKDLVESTDREPSWLRGEFSAAFGAWWDRGLPGAIERRVQWTIHISDISDEAMQFIKLMSTPYLVGFYFTGGRLLVDRFYDGHGCDVYITDTTSRIRVYGAPIEVIRVGTQGFDDWAAVARSVAERSLPGLRDKA